MSERCYYSDTSCLGATWQCKICQEHFCAHHGHTTDVGTDVECVGCEHVRRELEAERTGAPGSFLRVPLRVALERADLVIIHREGPAFEAEVTFLHATDNVRLCIADTDVIANARQIVAIDENGNANFKDSDGITQRVAFKVVDARGLAQSDLVGVAW
jgi:hypothetical protein